ncbi:unnamed protein product, partial [Prorocentrum cordatum]
DTPDTDVLTANHFSYFATATYDGIAEAKAVGTPTYPDASQWMSSLITKENAKLQE